MARKLGAITTSDSAATNSSDALLALEGQGVWPTASGGEAAVDYGKRGCRRG